MVIEGMSYKNFQGHYAISVTGYLIKYCSIFDTLFSPYLEKCPPFIIGTILGDEKRTVRTVLRVIVSKGKSLRALTLKPHSRKNVLEKLESNDCKFSFELGKNGTLHLYPFA